MLAEDDASGFQYSNDLRLAFARLAAAPADESLSESPLEGKDGNSLGSAYLSEVAAPVENERKAKTVCPYTGMLTS